MSYKISDQAPLLAQLLVDVAAEVAGAHPDMQAAAQAACEAHNRAINLMLGADEFANEWAAPMLDAEGNPVHKAWDPEQFAVALDSICIELRSRQSPYTPADAEMMRHRVGLVANIDTAHPVAKHWRVLQARSYPPGSVQDWPEFAAV